MGSGDRRLVSKRNKRKKYRKSAHDIIIWWLMMEKDVVRATKLPDNVIQCPSGPRTTADSYET